MRTIYLKFVTLLAILLIPTQIFGRQQTPSHPTEALATAPTPASLAFLPPEARNVLEYAFCSPQICEQGDWQQWIMITPESAWQAAELAKVGELLTAVIASLDQQGLDGRALLGGYRFRRQQGEYVAGHPGRIAVVDHTSQEITLADAAFQRLHGFYIIHELGHVVDHRTGRQLSADFHSLVGSDLKAPRTAANCWLNLAAKEDLAEATADAFALLIMSTYDAGYRPVFAYTPRTTDYERIVAAMAASIAGLS